MGRADNGYALLMTALGITLLLAGVVLAIAEAHLAAGGVLGAIGTAAAVAGTVLAVEGSGGGALLAAVTAVLVALVVGGFLAVALLKVRRSSRGRPRAGREALVGRHGCARTAVAAAGGQVFVEGALWRARPSFEDEPVEIGDEIVVERIDGLTLTVRKAEPWELPA